MIKALLQRLFAPSPALVENADPQAFAQLNAVAPIASSPTPNTADNSSSKSIVCREAVLNRQQRVAGYEFRVNHHRREQIHHITDSTLRLYDEVLLRNILLNDLERLLGHRSAFIPLSVYSLDNPLILQLPRNSVLVLECSPECSADFRSFAASILPRLAELRQAGYRIGLTRYSDMPEMQPFLEIAEFIRLDVKNLPFDDIQRQIQLIRNEAVGKQFVAYGIDSLEMLHACLKLPFNYFHGAFITRRETWDTKSIGGGRLHIINLLNQIRQKADSSVIARELKHDPALTYKLLRFINSPASGLTTRITSIEQALMLLGMQPLYRWLTLLLFVCDNGDPLDAALLENALIRARLTELLWYEQHDRSTGDELFITGLFSLLDQLLQMPLPTVLADIKLSEPVTQALLQQQGPYAPYLALASASEAFDLEGISLLAEMVGIRPERLNRLQIDAMIWAQEMDSES